MDAYLINVGIDGRIAALVRGQYGTATRRQLATAGLDRSAIGRRLAAGRLHRLHAGVYAVGHDAPRREARWLAAVLACGPGAVLSHRSAASLWRIREGEGPRPNVTAEPGSARRHPGVHVHRSSLAADDRVVHAGIPVTSPARTLVDLAHEIQHDEMVRSLREAQFRRIFDLTTTREALTRRPSRVLRLLIEDLVVTQTRLEDRLLAICDHYKIERPLTQHSVNGRRADFVWPRQRLVVETDGWEAHGTRGAFQSDRASSNALQLRGYVILRFTAADLRRRPAQVARQIQAALRH